MKVPVKFKKLRPKARVPKKATEGSACHDVFASGSTWVSFGRTSKIYTGIALEVPKGYEIEIRPRSGLSMKGLSIVNSPGTLDSDFRGELVILMTYFPKNEIATQPTSYLINDGDRIAQIKVNEVLDIDWVQTQNLSVTKRGEGGYGSTGK